MLLTYKVPVGSVIAPYERTGPPAYYPAYLKPAYGTYRDWGAAEFYHTAHADYVGDQSIFVFCPADENYAGSTRQVRIRYRSTVNVGNVRWVVTHEPSGDGDPQDTAFTGGPNAVTSTVAGTIGDLKEEIITLTGTAWAAGDGLWIHILRESSNVLDTHAASVDIVDIDVLIDVPLLLIGSVRKETFTAASFTFAAGVSYHALAHTPVFTTGVEGFRALYRNGVRDMTDVTAAAPTTALEYLIQAGPDRLVIGADITATGDVYEVVYPA